MEHGHPEAMHYPIGRVYDEARLIMNRRNGELVGLAVIIQAATATTGFTASEKAVDHFRKLIKALEE